MVKIEEAIKILVDAAYWKREGRVMQMPGDGRYQPDDLKPYLGYDQFAGWLVIVEWFWLETLAEMKMMSASDAKSLTPGNLKKLIYAITTTKQDQQEKYTKHDIIALLELMRFHLPKRLHRHLHFCATSYDIISTAYALQLKVVFEEVCLRQIHRVDNLWCEKIKKNVDVLQAGRTHLQTALPVTIGFWLAGLHRRFIESARMANHLAKAVPGKFSGAVGTYAAQVVLLGQPPHGSDRRPFGEKALMLKLGLPAAGISTQIAPPEAMARSYFELVLLSGVMANLGEDVRILQSSQFGELISASSTSSTMSHKTANPIAAENMAGMHECVKAAFQKITGTLVSDLQRDLRGSCVMRSFSEVMVYTYQQLLTTERLLKSLTVDGRKCEENFNRQGRLVVAEVLHLALQRAGLESAHYFVNKLLVPAAMKSGRSLPKEIYDYITHGTGSEDEKDLQKRFLKVWRNISPEVKKLLENPEEYLGEAHAIAWRESGNSFGADAWL